MDRPGFEPGTEACKATVLPTIPTAHYYDLCLVCDIGFEPMRSLRASTFQKWHSDLTELIAEIILVACSRNRTGPEAYEASVLPSHSAATVFKLAPRAEFESATDVLTVRYSTN